MKKTCQTINSVLSRKPKNHSTNIKSLIVNGLVLSDDSEIAEALNKHFATVGQKIDESLPNNTQSQQVNLINYRHVRPSSSFFSLLLLPE